MISGRGTDSARRPLPAMMYRMLIPARPVHLAVFGAIAIAAHLLGWLTANEAVMAGFIPLIILLVASIAIDVMRPSSCRTPSRRR